MNQNKLHIVHTHPSNLGGVANHYRGLRNCWPVPFTTSLIGSRCNVSGALFFTYDLISLLIKSRNSSVVLLNPSMQKKAFWRDFILLITLISLKRRVVIFFHGWDKNFADKVLKFNFVKKVLSHCKIVTLATKFNKQLKEYGLNKIYLSSTKFDKNLLSYEPEDGEKTHHFTILFTGRLVKSKGVQKLLESIANSTHKDDFRLIVAGDGPYKKFLVDYAKILGVTKLVNFTGYVRDEELAKLYRTSHVYVLPTSHNEGLPTSILEALAFGLPVISTDAGGITDVISHGQNGFVIDNLDDSSELTKRIEFFYLNPEKLPDFRKENLLLSKKFSSSNVARKLTKIIFGKD